MRMGAAILAALSIAGVGCSRRPVIIERTVHVTLNPIERTISSRGPSGSVDYHWPYAIQALSGRGAPGEWSIGVAYAKDRTRPNNVEIRCFDAPNGLVKVEVDFTGVVSPDLASVTFLPVKSVDEIVVLPKGGEGERDYAGWILDQGEFQLRAPPLGGKIAFLARLR